MCWIKEIGNMSKSQHESFASLPLLLHNFFVCDFPHKVIAHKVPPFNLTALSPTMLSSLTHETITIPGSLNLHSKIYRQVQLSA